MISFRTIASSSAGCCYELRSPGMRSLLIECGIPFGHIQRALDHKATRLAGCLVSHAHHDHSKGAFGLMRAGIVLAGSEETLDQIRTTDGERALGHHWARVLHDGESLDLCGWIVRGFPCEHDCPGTLGFVISGEGARCLYLTDSAFCRYTFTGLTHIFVECNHSQALMRENVATGRIGIERYKRTVSAHMSLERLLDMLAANDLSQVQEIHLLHLSDTNSDATGFCREIQAATGRPVFVAGQGVRTT